ncbi:MAG: hypothetical protein LVQ63_01105 [Thermoplasmatales archaeon]|nr:hypothetical protein [Thermoplasmatales archaeon]
MSLSQGNQPYPYGGYPGGRKKSRTRTGILLIAIGLILTAIPSVGDFLSLLILVGLVILVLGSSEISKLHRRMSIISMILFIVATGVGLTSVLRYNSLIAIISSATSISYSTIVKYTDPFLFFISFVYVIIDASLFLAVYSVFPRKGRIVLWVFYIISFLVVSLGIYSSMNTLNGLYYQPVTFSNLGVFSSVAHNLDGFVALFLILWAIAYFLTFFGLRKTLAFPAPNVSPAASVGMPPVFQGTQPDLQQPPTSSFQPRTGSEFLSRSEQQNFSNSQGGQPGVWSSPAVPPVSDSGGGNETILFIHPGANLATIDRKRVSIPPHSGSVVITDRRFMFLSRGRGGTAATALLGGPLTWGLLSKTTTKVDESEINDTLRNPGSFSVELRSIRKINAFPSTFWRPGKIEIDVADQVRPNGTDASGSLVLFGFMGRGSPGGTTLKHEEVSYLNNNVNTIIRSLR